MRRSAVFAAEVLAWWGACTGVWLITLSSVPAVQLYTAVATGLPCGVAAASARRLAGNAWRARPVWLRAVAVLPLAIVTDSIQVMASVLPGKRSAGEETRVRIPNARGEHPEANWHRAVATWLVCASPATFMIDFSPDDGEARIHRLPVRGPSVLSALGAAQDE